MRIFVTIITIAIVALMVREAKSQHYIDRNGTYLTSVPNPYYTLNGGMMRGATWAHIVADGGREATVQETADWQAAQDAAALAAADAAAQEAEASQFPTPEVIVPVLNADGEPTGTARLLVDDLGNLVVVTDTASPRRPAKVQLAEFKTKRMAHAARLEVVRVAAAKGGGLPELRARVEALEALHGIGLKTDDGTAGSPGKPEDPPGKPEDPPGKPNKPGK